MLIAVLWLFVILHMSAVWLLYRYLKNPSVVDVGWASGLTMSGLIYLFCQPYSTQTLVAAILLILWGMRLGLYLWYTRIRLGHVDKRYLDLSADWKIAKPLGFFLNFQLQGLLIVVIATPFYFIGKGSPSDWHALDTLGLLLVVIGLFGETVADQQLQHFKNTSVGKVCNQGLWYYSRHPNYFFEWLVWCGFTLFALWRPYGAIALISPLTLYLIMTFVTGPMTEAGSLKKRGKDYEAYQKTTPMFFPKFKS